MNRLQIAALAAGFVLLLGITAWAVFVLPDIRERDEFLARFDEEASVVRRLVEAVRVGDDSLATTLVADSQPLVFLMDKRDNAESLFRAIRRSELIDGVVLGSGVGLDFDLGLEECEDPEVPGRVRIFQAQLVDRGADLRVERLYVAGC